MKTKPKLKPRRLWANYYRKGCACHRTKKVCQYMGTSKTVIAQAIPVAVIPLDDADCMISKARAAYMHNGSEFTHENMRAALTAIGVLPKARAKKGGRK